MDGFYSIWTKPYFLGKENTKYEMSDFEILTFVLSVLEWQKRNGDAYLICDEPARQYISSYGLDNIFKGGVMSLVVDDDINPKVFWAAGKLYALRMLKKPMVMVDMDLIVWKNIDKLIADTDIYGIHREQIRPEVYPDLDYFKFKDGYKLSSDYDREVLPLNTALLYIKDLDFIHTYADEAIEFMRHSEENTENLKHMVFAEQRLLPILAKQHGKEINTMFDIGENISYQEYFTHVWGHKNILKYNDDEKQKFCARILGRIKKDFSEYYELTVAIPEVAALDCVKEEKA